MRIFDVAAEGGPEACEAVGVREEVIKAPVHNSINVAIVC